MSVPDLANYFFSTNPKDREYYHTLFGQLDKADASTDSVMKLVQSIKTSKMLRELSIQAYETAEGRGTMEDIISKFEALKEPLNDSGDNPNNDEDDFVTDDLDELLDEYVKKPGLRWRLKALNRILGSLRKGDFGFIFARPETGKTTFLASEITYMAEQIPEDGGPILWFNNEEQGDKVKLRTLQAALGVTLDYLKTNRREAKQKYSALIRGKICLVDKAQLSKKTVERLCKEHKPSLIIFDQVDKITGFDNDREDLRLGSIYQWARELAKEYAPVIGVCQADGSGEGVKWLTMSNVANAKTSKQAEADWILGIGKIHDAGYDSIRYLHASKNKLLGDEDTDPGMRHGKVDVLIEAQTARYKDIYEN